MPGAGERRHHPVERRSDRRWCAVALAAALMLPAPAVASRAAPRRPNLLLITADDLNGDSMGWTGQTAIATPALDRLAATSHRFVNAHVTAPICQPSRAALMTGRVPHRSGALGFDPVRHDVPTLVEVLRAHGYFTAAINKLRHLQPASKFPWDLALHGSGRRPHAAAIQVARCLAAARRAGRPFFVNVNLTDPHRPFRHHARPAWRALRVPAFLEDLPPIRAELAAYLGSVRRLDAGVGAVLATLAAAADADDTVVVFLSDNGMSFPFAKATVYANGTWAPVLLRHAALPPPATHTELVSSVDLMPTVLALLGVPAPDGMDGRSWGPLLHGVPEPGRDLVVTHVQTVRSGAAFPQRCVRTRTRSLIYHGWSGGTVRFAAEPLAGRSFAALHRTARHDPRVAQRVRQLRAGAPLALYDLERDPGERRNLLHVPAYRGDVARLAAALLAHMERTGDPELAGFRAIAPPP